MPGEASASVSPVPTEPAEPQASTSSAPPTPNMGSHSASSAHRSRTLILCFDGTANQYDGDNTNVVKFYSLLKKDTTDDQQLCYYQPGIGTYLQPGAVQPIFQWGAKILDEAVAWYLDEHVQGGYTFLMQNYCPGDKICIFGFSRGAYTARALAGMLHKIGLLPKDNPEQVPLAYKLYQNSGKDSRTLAAGFKQTFCRSVPIEFVGVWDTVASVGLIRSKTLPFTTTNTTIRTFRHALSLDERRSKFQPNLYHRLTPDASATVTDLLAIQEDDPNAPSPVSAYAQMQSIGDEVVAFAEAVAKDATESAPVEATQTRTVETEEKPPKKKGFFKRLFSKKHFKSCLPKSSSLRGDNIVNPSEDPANGYVPTDVKEVWFAGCHSDVGGGSVANSVKDCLADIPLRWMVRQVEEAQCGIVFDSDALRAQNIPESIFAGAGDAPPAAHRSPRAQPLAVQTHGAATGQKQLEACGCGRASEESRASDDSGASEASAIDAVQPLHDELKLDKWWWLLEIIPTNYTYQDARGAWHSRWSLHLGRGRNIPSAQPNFHVTVRERMADPGLKYKPAARWKTGCEVYVE